SAHSGSRRRRPYDHHHADEQHRESRPPAEGIAKIFRHAIDRFGAVIEMLRLGLTGGIASGKSAVAAMLRELGFAVLDADGLAHKLIEPGQPAYEQVLREFGPSITDGQARVDRVKLGALVFADRAKLARLNAIVHPRVADAVSRQFDE